MFALLVPWLILLATLLFLLQPDDCPLDRDRPAAPVAVGHADLATLVFQFFVAVYGGYFGRESAS